MAFSAASLWTSGPRGSLKAQCLWTSGSLLWGRRNGAMDRVSDDVGLSRVSWPLREDVSKFCQKADILLLCGIEVSSTGFSCIVPVSALVAAPLYYKWHHHHVSKQTIGSQEPKWVTFPTFCGSVERFMTRIEQWGAPNSLVSCRREPF